MQTVTLTRIRDRLANHTPVAIRATHHAAVAMLLQPRADDVYVMFIHRAHHPHDPWSGHMAFPGGRRERQDPNLFVTIRRETFEEVGIRLEDQGEYLGRLADIPATAGGTQTGMVVSPFVYQVTGTLKPVLDPLEVQDILWVPLSLIVRGGAECTVRRELAGGSTIEVAALLYRGKTIWGLTHRMLRGFVELIRET